VGRTAATSRKQQQAATESVEEAVKRRAYELHLEGGGAHGCDVDDWLQAEREIQARHQSPATRTKKQKQVPG
jgi:hypothetical protein